ncbi:MAG: hypothetical protein ACRDQB_14160 [Thermocrispum sp.]
MAAAARRRARDEQKSLSAYLTDLVQRDVETAQRDEFWADVQHTMTTPAARAELAADADEFAPTLTDGLEA